MNVSLFIAKRIAFDKQKSFSRFIIRLATAATAISVAAMILTLAFVNGFQEVISQKIFSFWGHLRVENVVRPISVTLQKDSLIHSPKEVLELLHKHPEVTDVNAYATKSAVVQKGSDIEGILIKGIAKDYHFSQIQPFLRQGRWMHFDREGYTKEIVLSEQTAQALKVHINDELSVYFIESAAHRASLRKLKVVGIYKTGIEEYDKLFALTDLRLVQRMNEWPPDKIDGYELFLKDYQQMDRVNLQLYNQLPEDWSPQTIKEVYPNIFDWLNVQDVNRNVIFVIMSIVAIINLITCLLILVLERTRMTGVLKATGCRDWDLQKIFLYHATIIAVRGVFFGVIFGLGVALLQQYTGFIQLDEAAYYVKEAPVKIIWWHTVLIVVATVVVCYLSLLLPTALVRRIDPVKAIRFQ